MCASRPLLHTLLTLVRDRASFSPFAQRTQQYVKESLGQGGEKVMLTRIYGKVMH